MSEEIKTKYDKSLLELEDLVQYTLNLENENERLHSIIKEVREIVEEKANEEIGGLSNKLLEIMDKENICTD